MTDAFPNLEDYSSFAAIAAAPLPNDDDDSDSEEEAPEPNSPRDVIQRIERCMARILDSLNEPALPVLASLESSTTTTMMTKRFNLSQCRSFASICMVLSFCHSLLYSGSTATVRQVYYYHVTHFRSQRECDAAILDAAALLGVPRVSLGLAASPKGWFCGSVELVRANGHVTDASQLSSVQGLAITREWIDRSSFTRSNHDVTLRSKGARCILVIEKEGIYNRLSEDAFFESIPCILVTGKGFPDLATRALVKQLYEELQLPVFGLCDCNPFGCLVLHTYQRGSAQMGVDGGDRYGVPLQWLGLKPSHVSQDELRQSLPRSVFQKLTPVDKRRLEGLCDETHPFHQNASHDVGTNRMQELQDMLEQGYKLELEALHWVGMEYLSEWLKKILLQQLEPQESQASSMGGHDDF